MWKRLGKELDMNKTLEENGIPDESDMLSQLGIPADEYYPALHIDYNDWQVPKKDQK